MPKENRPLFKTHLSEFPKFIAIGWLLIHAVVLNMSSIGTLRKIEIFFFLLVKGNFPGRIQEPIKALFSPSKKNRATYFCKQGFLIKEWEHIL